MKYFKNSENKVFAFDDGVEDIPVGLTEVTEAEASELALIPPPMDLDVAKNVALRKLNMNFSEATYECRGYYQCAGERETWGQQKKEAEAYTDDPLADTPFMDAFAAANPNMTKAQLAATILANASAMASAAGELGGQLSAKRAAILAAQDKEALNAVDLTFTLPSINLTDK